MPPREQNSNKGTFGKVLNICGSRNYIGAAFLPTLSSLKVGAGFSALCSTKEVISSVSKLLPEAVYLERKGIENRLGEFSVIVIGCGLSTDKDTISLFKKVLKNVKNLDIPVLIDADGLNILAKLKKIDLPKSLIITPHPIEAARLLGVNSSEVLQNLEVSAKELTKKYNCVTVLKNHKTIICDKNLELHINQNGNSALAKAGSGDVLAGVIAGLLAQKMSLFEASKLGVHLHARAGELASQDLTEYSVLATDTIKYLPNAIKELL